MFIRGDGEKGATYTVANFPRGSSIEVEYNFASVAFHDNRVEFFSEHDEGSVTIDFEGIKMSRDKFRYEDRVLTYKEDALLDFTLLGRCRKFHRIRDRAIAGEIKI